MSRWVPRFGYKKAKAEQEKNWMMEYKVRVTTNDLVSVINAFLCSILGQRREH